MFCGGEVGTFFGEESFHSESESSFDYAEDDSVESMETRLWDASDVRGAKSETQVESFSKEKIDSKWQRETMVVG